MSVVTFPDAGGDLIRFLDVDGTLYPYVEGADQANAIRASADAIARQDDIILCNYPKSGGMYATTAGVDQRVFDTSEDSTEFPIYTKDTAERKKDANLLAIVGTHWLWEAISMIQRGSATTIPDIKQNHMIEVISADDLAAIPSPRVLNTHFRFSQLPRDAIKKRCKIVLTLRNPKDLAVSFYNHHKNLVNLYKYDGKWENYLSLFSSGKVDYGSFYDYVLDWEQTIRENTNYPIHVIYYEDMKEDSGKEVRKLTKFMGVELSDDLINAIAEKCSFQNMVNDKIGFENEVWKKMWRDEKPLFYRKGEVGDWKNWFTVAQNEEFDKMYAKRMSNSKLTFRFSLS